MSDQMEAIQKADAALYDVAAKQLVFKPSVIRNTMLDIAGQLLDDRIKWGDEFELSADTNNCNCIGTAFRLLIRAEVIVRMEQHRRSQRERQKGRVVWKYRLGSESLARLFIARNGRTPHTSGQPELNL